MVEVNPIKTNFAKQPIVNKDCTLDILFWICVISSFGFDVLCIIVLTASNHPDHSAGSFNWKDTAQGQFLFFLVYMMVSVNVLGAICIVVKYDSHLNTNANGLTYIIVALAKIISSWILLVVIIKESALGSID